jgi:hypothetical protein
LDELPGRFSNGQRGTRIPGPMRNLENRNGIESTDALQPSPRCQVSQNPAKTAAADGGVLLLVDSDSKQLGSIFPGMLRLRKKPPTGLPAVRSGNPWSARDITELAELVVDDVPVNDIAAYLCRTVAEVERKIASLKH